MHLITPKMPLWKANIDEAARIFPDPFWAFCWPGSYGLCRFLIYNPHTVANRNVLDFAAGCGIAGIVAKQLGAESVVINDIDELACDAAKVTSC
jgi:predicted nicotinamide N-methyase